jgi:CarD family transcriptional regulator
MPEDKSAVNTATPFQVNQKVVYPLQGVGQIMSITERVFKGKPTQYFQIFLPVTDMTVMIPVGKAVEIGIRAIVPKEKAQEAFNIIASDFEPVTADWKMRYQMNLDHLKSGDITDIALVVRNLYHRSKVKELPILERKLYDSAMKLLIDEIAFSLDISVGEVEKIVHEKLEPLGKGAALAAMDPDADEEEFGPEPEEEDDEDE